MQSLKRAIEETENANEPPAKHKNVQPAESVPSQERSALGDLTAAAANRTAAPAAPGAKPALAVATAAAALAANNNALVGARKSDDPRLLSEYGRGEAEEYALKRRTDLPPGVEDIDADDYVEPMFCAEYADDIYSHMIAKEAEDPIDPEYMSRQPHINARMRAILVDWMLEVSYKFKLVAETYFLAISIVDRYLQRKEVARADLQLVGVAAILVASKVEEVYSIEIGDLVYISDNTYTKQQIILAERDVLCTIAWNVTVPYPIQFLRRCSKALANDGVTHTVGKYLVELATVDYGMLKYRPSLVAAAAAYLARRMTGKRDAWTTTAAFYTGYTEEQILQAARDLNNVVMTPNPKLKAVRTKFASSKFAKVSELPGVRNL